MKVGDFSLSLSLNPSQNKLKGVKREYCLPDINKAFNENKNISKEELFKNDVFALYTTFNLIYEKFKKQID